VGGALQKNAGGWGRAVGDCVEEVEFLDTEGNILKLPASEISFGDGAAKLPEGAVILSVTFRSQPKDPGFVASMAQDFRKRRAANYPSPQGAMGPVFKNPMGKPVDKMIDLCGLKGVRVGDAEISRLNPNYILNIGSAEAANVVSLIGLVQERVYMKFKVKIEPAALILGSWQKDKMRIKE
jgi:UDP-N-acetylmuramate dehydrogenase